MSRIGYPKGATQPARVLKTLNEVGTSFAGHPNRWMYSLLAIGFLIRVWQASGTYLNPDEALHFFAANKTSWWLTYRASLTVSHPPLLVFLLHIWRVLGTSEVVLRLPSIIAGTAFCWYAFRWMQVLFSDAVVWPAFTWMVFLPSLIDLSSEIRQYALFLMFATSSAYFLERALHKNSPGLMLASGVSLWLALLSHFSGFLFAATLGVYALWRMIRQRVPLKVFAAWEFSQVLGVAICYWLYVTQISRLGQNYGGANPTQGWMENAYLGNVYFEPGKINPLLFVIARSGGVFQYIFDQAAIGDLAFLLFIAGVVIIVRHRGAAVVLRSEEPERTSISAVQVGTLLLLPFAFNCIAALFRLYPYGGTRHSAFLIPFALTGVAVAIASKLRDRLALGVGTALLISLLCNLYPSKPAISRQSQSKQNMNKAVALLRALPRGELIFADYQTSFMVGHYLCDQKPIDQDRSVPGFASYSCGDREVIVTTDTFMFSPRSFYDHWQSFMGLYKLQPGTKVCVVQMGWSISLTRTLAKFPDFHFDPHYFGDNINMFELAVGQKLPDPARLPGS